VLLVLDEAEVYQLKIRMDYFRGELEVDHLSNLALLVF
jgi:hypothetical protein